MENLMPKDAVNENTVAEVLLDHNLEKPLDYAVPSQWRSQVRIGLRVEVPVQTSARKGTISLLKQSSSYSLKGILRLLPEESSLPESLWKLALWMSRYYCCSLQRVLRLLTPPSVRKEIHPRLTVRARLAISHTAALSLCAALRARYPAQASVLEMLAGASTPLPVTRLMEDLRISRAPMLALVKKKAIHLEQIEEDPVSDADFFQTSPKKLNTEQSACLEKICQTLGQKTFAAHLVHGVTGSGKTEIYLQAIQYTLDQGRSAILLVPEIALTSQTIERFRARFGLQLAIFHHRRSPGERTAAWEGLRCGRLKIAIGARSAIFSPAQNLGLIIVDEEHDSSYKQTEEMPTYHARDVSVMRAKIENAAVILGSATPSLESFLNAKTGKYVLSTLHSRATHAPLPQVSIVDMKIAIERTGGFTHFSPGLLDAIQDRCQKGEQILLLLNRRGFHRMQICAECRHIIKCPHCDITLTFHRETNELRCHLCNHETSPLRQCPQCRSQATLEFKGFGTEHVERSLHAIFPSIRTLRMDRDTTRRKESHEALFKQFRAHKADVLIGTQMIAKGFHFPSVTLVGVLNADASLQIPDFRSSEVLFQLLTQVAGRAGRAELAGEVILQTFIPNHPMLQLAASQNYNIFFEQEVEERKLFFFPPFCRLIKLVFIGPIENAVSAAAAAFHAQLLQCVSKETQLLPLLPSGHPKIKDLYRFQFLIKTTQVLILSEKIQLLRQSFTLPPKTSLLVDIDPTSTFF
jgi:primosomal protein N' (replication factor Y)